MDIRPATVADLAAIDDIYHHYVLSSTCTFQVEPGTPQERAAWFAAHGGAHPVTVAVGGGDVVGWGSLSRFHPRAAYRFTVENSVYVRADRHRRGIGRALLVDLIERAARAGHHAILASITADQDASIALHRSLGFEPVARLREIGFKFGRWLDVVYLERILPA
ncbi:MAG TPA: GNAT family N-acetyltransferase [Haliangiales bacterium]|nr:GNAT family N-acetyltransferase [Haliangiales bacterium]